MSYALLATNAVYPNSLVLDDVETGALYRGQFNWIYRNRGADPKLDNLYVNLWPTSSMMNGDPSTPLDLLTPTGFEPPDWGYGGLEIPWFINGQCLAANGTPLTGVTVQAFTSDTSTFVNQVTSDSNGNFSVPTHYLSSNHYLVAYMTASPALAGTTSNQLQPGQTPG